MDPNEQTEQQMIDALAARARKPYADKIMELEKRIRRLERERDYWRDATKLVWQPRVDWLQGEIKTLTAALRDVATSRTPEPRPTPQRVASEALDEHQVRVAEANAGPDFP